MIDNKDAVYKRSNSTLILVLQFFAGNTARQEKGSFQVCGFESASYWRLLDLFHQGVATRPISHASSVSRLKMSIQVNLGQDISLGFTFEGGGAELVIYAQI